MAASVSIFLCIPATTMPFAQLSVVFYLFDIQHFWSNHYRNPGLDLGLRLQCIRKCLAGLLSSNVLFVFCFCYTHTLFLSGIYLQSADRRVLNKVEEHQDGIPDNSWSWSWGPYLQTRRRLGYVGQISRWNIHQCLKILEEGVDFIDLDLNWY